MNWIIIISHTLINWYAYRLW